VIKVLVQELLNEVVVMSDRAKVKEICDLEPKERAEVINNLDQLEALQLLYDWEFWARPKQRTPQNAWNVWLLLAGRG